MTVKYSPLVCMEQVADALCVSLRTATRMCKPLRQELGLRGRQSFTKQQIEDYFGENIKRPIRV